MVPAGGGLPSRRLEQFPGLLTVRQAERPGAPLAGRRLSGRRQERRQDLRDHPGIPGRLLPADEDQAAAREHVTADVRERPDRLVEENYPALAWGGGSHRAPHYEAV